MDIKDQLDIISSYQKGIPVFCNSKYTDDKYNWKKVTSDHQFNFDIEGFGRFHLLRWNSKKPKSNF